MPARPTTRRRVAPERPRPPQQPRLPASLGQAVPPEHDLVDEATLHRLAFEVDLSGRTAEAVELEQCRLQGGADLAGTVLDRARLADCVVEQANLANLHTRRSTLHRSRVSTSRMTGLHWVDGSLRDVTISGCRADLTGFRFTEFRHVVFEDCNLTRADFANADLSGAEFIDCDLTGAQFSHATAIGTWFRGCTLAGIGGVTSLAGATVAAEDLVALSYTLAAGLGIQLDGADGRHG